jgi:hypothetical protein
MTNLFTNEKETKRAIKAAVDQSRMVLKKNRPIHCAVCGCVPRPDEWSSQVENCCFDCA